MCIIKNLKLDKETFCFYKGRAIFKNKKIELEIADFLKEQAKILKQQSFKEAMIE